MFRRRQFPTGPKIEHGAPRFGTALLMIAMAVIALTLLAGQCHAAESSSPHQPPWIPAAGVGIAPAALFSDQAEPPRPRYHVDIIGRWFGTVLFQAEDYSLWYCTRVVVRGRVVLAAYRDPIRFADETAALDLRGLTGIRGKLATIEVRANGGIARIRVIRPIKDRRFVRSLEQ